MDAERNTVRTGYADSEYYERGLPDRAAAVGNG